MSETTENDQETSVPDVGLESSTYEIIRNRLLSSGRELKSRLDSLNEARKAAFGSIETALLSTERITTDHNCIPQDMVAVGNRFVFGYNIHFGLKSETDLEDVFSVYSFEDRALHAQDVDLLRSEGFERDFKELFRYYKNAEFSRFAQRGVHLFMVFRVGRTSSEVKVFKWILQPGADQPLQYVDNRSEHEFRYPPQHDFEWVRSTRDDHHYGEHPHVSIKDRVFVETVGGDLTIKIENNTATGEGIYAEPVDNPDQTLDDAEILYAIVGNTILLRMRPYQEKEYRHFVYNEKLQRAMRLDSVADACILLPDDHGLIFSNGYYLQDGEYKTFDHNLSGMLFERTIAAPNGEDFLYVFYNQDSSTYVLLHYNLIEQKVSTPLICNGWTFFEAGELLCFKTQGDAQKHHAIQLWQTPYVGADYVAPVQNDSYLHRIGNKDIVRGMAECHEVLKLINKEDSYANLYTDLVKQSGDIVDSYFWLTSDETFQLAESLLEVKAAASAAVDEFDKVVRVRRSTLEQTQAAEQQVRSILGQIRNRRFEGIEEFVATLAELRSIRGNIISLQELRYVDAELVASLEADVGEQTDKLSQKCVKFLLQPESLQPYEARVAAQQGRIEGLTREADARQLEEDIGSSAADLEMLIEIVSNLKIDDATHRTTIIDNVSTIFSTINTARAVLKKKRRELASVEGVAEFNSQMKLLNQGVVNYLDLCDAPEKCDEFLTKLMVQLEELEGRFAEFDDFLLQLTEKREEVYNAFESRKLQLVEARNKRATSLVAAADRVLKGIASRLQSFESVNDINGYFASDLMIEKVRDIVEQLKALDDSVRVDEIQSRLKTVREDAVRQLKDRQELFVDGENAVRFGQHVFSVNTQPLDLTTVLRDDELNLHLTGTSFFEPIVWGDHSGAVGLTGLDDPVLFRQLLNQEVVSENAKVYRAEFLAWQILLAADEQSSSEAVSCDELLALEDGQLLAFVQRFMGPRYAEGYTKGVHDVDAVQLLRPLLSMQQSVGLLRFSSEARAQAMLCWHLLPEDQRAVLQPRLKGAGQIEKAFGVLSARHAYVSELHTLLADFGPAFGWEDSVVTAAAAEYLYQELSAEAKFLLSESASGLLTGFREHLKRGSFTRAFQQSVKAVAEDPRSCFVLLRHWLQAYVTGSESVDEIAADYISEAAVGLMPTWKKSSSVLKADVNAVVSGLVGSHPLTQQGDYHLNYNRFTDRLQSYCDQQVPQFTRFAELKHRVIDRARDEMRLEEFRPRVLTSFVRNKLLNDVYLPLIGDNLAKQIGSTGEGKRTDLMGLLLLVSPPGYGKTTLMEYIANRLGLIFMKINGPALGHSITSLDPSEATNAGAREEVEKLNLAFEMGDNVMIYLDDIQHTHPEFLQKFISLCDAQRKIEGVYKGRTRTYDLRGRKVAVVMAGNPYTESGEKFQIPDMLSNRADIYNLGEIIGESADAFEMSYLENALTSNPVLSRLASRSQQDVYAIIRMANNEPREDVDLEGNYSLEEISELVSTMQKLMRVRDVILTVNREYIRSAAQSDDYRTEPAFKLQGSYRNMNRIAEKVVPIMNDDELTSLIVSNYENDAQTLTSGAEANLLKFRELTGLLTPEQQMRWDDIRRTFRQNLKMRGIDSDDKTGQVIATLATLNDGLADIQKAVALGAERLTKQAAPQVPATSSVPAPADNSAEEPALVQAMVQAVTDRFEDLRGELQQISVALVAGVDELKQREFSRVVQPQNPGQSGGAESTDGSAGNMAQEQTAPITAEGEAATPAAEGPGVHNAVAGRGESQKITIVNKIPPTVVGVLKQQFKLMNAWMQPIHEAATSQRRDMKRLQAQLEECLDLYRRLIGRIEDE
ncbi:MAG: DNA repair ATPase [Planctomycetaceae bacterium]|nr:DNA repair ATPase [Planctomycetaceae bacterium]